MLLPAFAADSASDGRASHPPGTAIASGHALATEAGFEIIRAGGNAFDAAIAVSSTLSVVEPISSGLGGGGFFLLHDVKTGKDVFLDAREYAPASATPEKYLDKDGKLDTDRAQNGPWSAGIPGLPARWWTVAGARPPAAGHHVGPGIRIARRASGLRGWPRLPAARRRDAPLSRYPLLRAWWETDREATYLQQPELARTLELWRERFRCFYRAKRRGN